MTKTLNQIIFFPPPKSEYFFSNIGNQNIFLEKNHNPPWKLNGPSLCSTELLCSEQTYVQFIQVELKRFPTSRHYFMYSLYKIPVNSGFGIDRLYYITLLTSNQPRCNATLWSLLMSLKFQNLIKNCKMSPLFY